MNTIASMISQARKSWALLLCLLVLLVVSFVHVRWLQEYRFGQSLDIDESGYITQSMAFARALIGGGVGTWLDAIDSPSAHAPFLPVFASVLMYFFGLSESVALSANVIVNFFLCLTVFLLASGLGGRCVGLISTIVIGAMPVLTDFARTFQFVLPASLFYLFAFFSYFKSRALDSAGWSVAVGVSLALMVLSRTMTLAFLPAFALSFLLHLYVEGRLKNPAVLRNIALAVGAFFLVALSWYLSHYRYVFEYLFSFGYGSHSAEYGKNLGFFTLANFESRLHALLFNLKPIHFFFVFPVFCLMIVDGVALWIRRKIDFRDSFLLCGASVCILSFLILSSSENRGFGFEAPVLVLMASLAIVWFCRRMRKWIAVPLVGGLLVGCIFLLYSKMDLSHCNGGLVRSSLPLLSEVPIADCRGLIHSSVLDGYLNAAGNLSRVRENPSYYREQALAWRASNAKLAEYVEQHAKQGALMVFASRHPLFNVNTMSLEEIKTYGSIRPRVQIDPGQLRKTPEGYLEWVTSQPVRSSCFVILLSTNEGEFEPKADTGMMEEALHADGYKVVESQATPREGQAINLWKRDEATCE